MIIFRFFCHLNPNHKYKRISSKLKLLTSYVHYYIGLSFKCQVLINYNIQTMYLYLYKYLRKYYEFIIISNILNSRILLYKPISLLKILRMRKIKNCIVNNFKI